MRKKMKGPVPFVFSWIGPRGTQVAGVQWLPFGGLQGVSEEQASWMAGLSAIILTALGFPAEPVISLLPLCGATSGPHVLMTWVQESPRTEVSTMCVLGRREPLMAAPAVRIGTQAYVVANPASDLEESRREGVLMGPVSALVDNEGELPLPASRQAFLVSVRDPEKLWIARRSLAPNLLRWTPADGN